MQDERRRRGGVQSVELQLDDVADALVRTLWGRLLDAGLPSQARHLGPSNRPHITLVALPTLPAEGEEQVARAAEARLPVLGTWGELAMFGSGPWTVVWLVDASAGMRRLQEEVARGCAVPDGHLTAPDRWTPHVTLARRVGAEALDAVRDLVGAPVADAAGTPVTAPTLRRWDSVAKVDWVVASASWSAGGADQP